MVGVQAIETDHFPPRETTVVVENDLAAPNKLVMHCQSDDDDLGVSNLSSGEKTSWSFKPNIFGTTLFWCNFNWNNLVKSVDIYNAKHDDHGECITTCLRSVREYGFYYYNEIDNQWYKKYTW
ncbi:S-protein homolog 2-like [Cicer arietinum]|uniref:S-protein homolog n=1 Tax=Cicer arietinum TaxID=3827 RepID=A0A1S2XGD1_CICAR|nr:S-protein homolog 2-like [Cicer arietinum]